MIENKPMNKGMAAVQESETSWWRDSSSVTSLSGRAQSEPLIHEIQANLELLQDLNQRVNFMVHQISGIVKRAERSRS